MARADIFHPDFAPVPYWWEAYRPETGELVEVPREARVAIVGGGYAGLAAALEFAKHGIDAVVLERGAPGVGASTRNGGAVSGGVNIGKSFSGRAAQVDAGRARRLLADGADAFALIERLIAEEAIECFWQKRGRFVGAWTQDHFATQQKRLASLNDDAQSGAYMVPRERQREEIASDYYYGGMVVERSASLHPALYYKGLVDACRRRGVAICAEAGVEKIAPGTSTNGAFWRVETGRGTVMAGDVVIATNGYTGSLTPALRRRIVPIASHIIATEPLRAGSGRVADPETAQHLRYQARALLLPHVARRHAYGVRRPRAVHPGRSDAVRPGAPRLHDRALSAAEGRPGDPQLDRQHRLHPRRLAAYGRGGRAPLLPRLQRQRGRDDDLSGNPDRAPDRAGWRTGPAPSTAANFPTTSSITATRGSCRSSAAITGCATGSIACSPEWGRMRYCRGRSLRGRTEMEFASFKSSLAGAAPPAGTSGALQALWWQAKGDWHQGHRCAQAQADEKGAWAHAYLHRVEGDAMNAGGWYKRAGKTAPSGPLDQEWEEIARALLG